MAVPVADKLAIVALALVQNVCGLVAVGTAVSVIVIENVAVQVGTDALGV